MPEPTPDPSPAAGALPGVACALAHPNIALVKYWGKRDARLNLPAAGSLSITLDALSTHTRVAFAAELQQDQLILDGVADAAALGRVSALLDVLRTRAGCRLFARVETGNNFPTAAGLASSASGFAALVVAASHALGLRLSPVELSRLARQGSGSAARSLFGGFVRMHAGRADDGSDAQAEPLLPAEAWPLQVVVAVTSRQRKAVASGPGMQHSAARSPYHAAWVASLDADLAAAEQAIAARDFAALAAVSEHSCLKMHATMMASQPPLLYWSPVTLACMQRVQRLREDDGLEVFFTVDAGPQVKAVCMPAAADAVAAALAQVAGVQQILRSGLGTGARVLPCADPA